MNLKQLSLHRQKVHLLTSRRNRLERIALGRSAMVAASLIPRRFRPEGPMVYYLSTSIGGESRHRYVRKGDVVYWGQRAQAWQKFQKALASWVKVSKEIEKELRQIGRLRCEPLPGGGRQKKE